MSKDTLVPQTTEQKDPYRAEGSDFPAPKGSGPRGMAEGKNQLASQSKNQNGPRYAEGEDGGSDSMSKRASAVSANFKVSKNSGEGSGQSSVSISESLDLSTGKIVSKGSKTTRVNEVPESKVSIG